MRNAVTPYPAARVTARTDAYLVDLHLTATPVPVNNPLIGPGINGGLAQVVDSFGGRRYPTAAAARAALAGLTGLTCPRRPRRSAPSPCRAGSRRRSTGRPARRCCSGSRGAGRWRSGTHP
ncbi:protein of unknown function [Candidatus Hydrogenisulfobacillus filiaventi]|uniref:Uncharacterized protein n=1 Tax=Candidatus Hydrogenisulfobacillus filiaventi TaxID=2707344 RepID=A0A6F8ZFB6_9FIRM|nr:protein of unknown function [Candidatus Hydrogenisulfobacillus filiaventi]